MKKVTLHYKDYVPLKNKSRQYVSKSTGEIISLRQFQTGAKGGVPLETRKKIVEQYKKLTGKEPTKQYIKNEARIAQKSIEIKKIEIARKRAENKGRRDRILDAFTDKVVNADKSLPPVSRDFVKNTKEFQDLLKDLRTKSNKPGGRKARALEKLGWRKKGASYDVGNTP